MSEKQAHKVMTREEYDAARIQGWHEVMLESPGIVHVRYVSGVPEDVARLVVAARIVAFENQSAEAIGELDQASEAFADRVPWDGEPDSPTPHQEEDRPS